MLEQLIQPHDAGILNTASLRGHDGAVRVSVHKLVQYCVGVNLAQLNHVLTGVVPPRGVHLWVEPQCWQ